MRSQLTSGLTDNGADMAARTWQRTALLALLMALVTIGLAAVASEVLLRVVYRDAGRRTLGGPGGQPFEHTFLDPEKEQRGPAASGPKAAGVQRVMVLGDSITWGQGVPAWTDTWPAKLLAALNAQGPAYDMAVFARPGREIDGHVAAMESAAADVSPDIVVYQWYNNDVELVKTGRPAGHRGWRGWSGHETLKRWSYLYFALDFAVDAFLPQAGRSYVQYLEEDYAEGTAGWRAFTQAFHTWAAWATGYANRTIVLLYPPVPNTALTDLRRRVAALAEGQVLAVAPAQMTHDIGAPSASADALSSGGAAGVLARTPGVVLAHGSYVATVQMRLDAPATGAVARVGVSRVGTAAVAAFDVDAATLTPGSWSTVRVPFTLDGHVSTGVSLYVTALGAAPLSVGAVALPVRYGIEVVDLQPHFGEMNTAASLFDAHPNAAAHAVIARVVAEQIAHPPAR